MFGISAWDLKGVPKDQSNLIITRSGTPTITVDKLEVAQFIYLLIDHKKLRDVLNSVIKRGVLILGRFGDGGLEILQAIAAKLREIGYLPIIFDFGKPEGRNFTETVIYPSSKIHFLNLCFNRDLTIFLPILELNKN